LKTLVESANKALAVKTKARLTLILKEAGDDIADYQTEMNDEEGTVTLDGHVFSFVFNALRLKGFCSICGQEAWSGRINSFGDIGSIIRNFKVGPHECA